MTTEARTLTCQAIIGQTPGPFHFEPVFCSQTVAVRGYWAVTPPHAPSGHFVTYCSIPGHKENVQRRYPPIEGQVEAPDPMDQAKWEADRRESWTLA